jgi:hypothetical protein
MNPDGRVEHYFCNRPRFARPFCSTGKIGRSQTPLEEYMDWTFALFLLVAATYLIEW